MAAKACPIASSRSGRHAIEAGMCSTFDRSIEDEIGDGCAQRIGSLWLDHLIQFGSDDSDGRRVVLQEVDAQKAMLQ